jgi:(1->4)-alpha-D-glucan 1-alpha-D-glucosylmutase
VTDETGGISAAEKEFLQTGLTQAKARSQGKDTRALEFLERILALEWFADMTEEAREEAREFVIRFQQLSGPATAKGLEDTAFYRYTRFVSLNEVGGNPGRFGISPSEFHEYNYYKQREWPHSMLATATHDTKRGEDTRARLNVLSEMPEEWEKAVSQWRELNAACQSAGAPAPSDEYLLYQTLVGTWRNSQDETYTRRIQEYMIKGMREAKTNTSWTDPNEAYERGTKEFIERILRSELFLKSFNSFAENVAFFGVFNSLAQVVLKICSPGVPDIYQGTELWDLSLVDPDNRRRVDYDARMSLLNQPKEPAELLRNWENGAVKLFTLASALKARKEYADVFQGDYLPVDVRGGKKDHIVAFARKSGSGTIIATAARFVRTLTGGKAMYPDGTSWEDTQLDFPEPERFRNVFTGEENSSLRVAEIFRTFPVSILIPLD